MTSCHPIFDLPPVQAGGASDAACGDDASSDVGNDAGSDTDDFHVAARLNVAERLGEGRDAPRAEVGAEGEHSKTTRLVNVHVTRTYRVT